MYNEFYKKKFVKKRNASGIHHKPGKQEYVGKVLFSLAMMKGKGNEASKSIEDRDFKYLWSDDNSGRM